MTAGLTLGGEASVYPLSGIVPSGIPALRQVQEAGAVRVAVKTRGKDVTGPNFPGGKPRDWLTLLAKEHLGSCLPLPEFTKTQAPTGPVVDLKYVTTKQKFTLEYDGDVSFFEIKSISLQPYDNNAPERLASHLQGLRVDPAPRIWIVGWDTTVAIFPADTLEPSESVKV